MPMGRSVKASKASRGVGTSTPIAAAGNHQELLASAATAQAVKPTLPTGHKAGVSAAGASGVTAPNSTASEGKKKSRTRAPSRKQQVPEATVGPAPGTSVPEIVHAGGTAAVTCAANDAELTGAAAAPQTPVEPAAVKKRRRPRSKSTPDAAPAVAAAAAADDPTSQAAREPASTAVNGEPVAAAKKQRRGKAPSKPAAKGGAGAAARAAGADGPNAGAAHHQHQEELALEAEEVKAQEEEEQAAETPKPKRKRVKKPELTIKVPTPEELEALAPTLQLPPLPVPNLGYACLNMELRGVKTSITTNRKCIKKTFDLKGLAHVSELTLMNSKDLQVVIQWNHEHNIRFFRLSSCIVPWMTEVQDMRLLPDYPEIEAALKHAGNLARAYGQRLTFHPSHFVKLAANDPDVLQKSVQELEIHGQVLDIMGFTPPSVENKINIHIGGVYGDKQATLARFEKNLETLSDSVRKRLTIENDDTPSAFSLHDLLPMSKRTGVPLVFDFHHHKFIETPLSEKESLEAAVATWPPGVRPVVHWSESQEGRIAKAHSDYVAGPIALHSYEDRIDVMVEAKCKEDTLLRYQQLAIERSEGRGEGALERVFQGVTLPTPYVRPAEGAALADDGSLEEEEE